MSRVRLLSEAPLPTRHGTFRCVAFAGPDGTEHVALVRGEVAGRDALVRVHSECLTGEALGSLKCDCGQQLDRALAQIAARGRGVLVYLRGHEGRGIGIAAKIRAYALQALGADTVDANRRLGLPDDARRYDAAAGVLRLLGVAGVELLTNNPAKVAALEALGITVARRVPIVVDPNPFSAAYLSTKRDRMDHALPADDAVWSK
jgi:3,4-dihydroxy 2-butanone 4-phosphate synthase/GTP cyclohydrolase II